MAGECTADQLLGGRYALVDILGHGASGVVWRARDQLLRRDVAVKEIRFPVVAGRDQDAGVRDAILREARAAARLNHPGAVTVYDVVEEEGRPLIVMELVDAPTLTQMVESSGPLAPTAVAAIGVELLEALEAGHASGIVHRDVKPRNVMVEGSGRVRLADFGVASVLDDARLTSGTDVVGSPAYMAPEQVTGDAVGPAADLWALGATLYFAVEGRPPFDKGTPVPTMTAIVREPPRPPRRAGPLGPLLEALLAKDPAARPTAGFLRLWLTEVAGGPDTPWSNDLEATAQFPGLPTDIEVPQGPGGPVGPGPTGPGGPVVIPKPSSPEVPAPSPPEPVPPVEPVPEWAPPGPDTVPDTVPDTDPDPDPERVPSEPDPLYVPSEPDPLVPGPPDPGPPPAAPQAAGQVARRWPTPVVVVAVVMLAILSAVGLAALAGGRDGAEEAAGDGQAAAPAAPTTAAGGAVVPADWVPYVDPSTGFGIAYPPGWTVSVDGSLTDFRDPSTGAYLRVDHVQPPGPSPEGAWLDFEPRFAAQHPGYQRIRIEPTTYAGFPAAVWEFTYGGGGSRLRAVDLGFVTPTYGFALNFQTPEADWDRLQPVFEAFKAGFRPPA